jgi:hypothetical protein
MSDNVEPLKLPPDHRTLAREERLERRALRDEGGRSWMVGLVLVAIGVLYLLHNYGLLPTFTNWWALFLLLPGMGTLSAARGAFRRHGNLWDVEVLVPFLASLFFLGLTLVFLFDIAYGWLWPLFLIAAGLLILAAPRSARR